VLLATLLGLAGALQGGAAQFAEVGPQGSADEPLFCEMPDGGEEEHAHGLGASGSCAPTELCNKNFKNVNFVFSLKYFLILTTSGRVWFVERFSASRRPSSCYYA
jgi:hypothetical protein